MGERCGCCTCALTRALADGDLDGARQAWEAVLEETEERDMLRAEASDQRDLLADALGWLLAEHQDLDVDAPEQVVEACEWVRGVEPPGGPVVDVPVTGGRL